MDYNNQEEFEELITKLGFQYKVYKRYLNYADYYLNECIYNNINKIIVWSNEDPDGIINIDCFNNKQLIKKFRRFKSAIKYFTPPMIKLVNRELPNFDIEIPEDFDPIS